MRPKGCLWWGVLALAVSGGAAAQDGVSAPQPEEPAAGALERGLAGILDFNFGGRVLTSGSLSYDLRASRAVGDSTSLSHLLTGNLTGRSYIYAPWFATVTGNLRLSTTASHTTYTATSVHTGTPQDSSEQFLSGGLRVNIFPRSRFPAEVRFEHSDSRAESGLASFAAFQSNTFGVSQRYRPENGAFNLSGTYDYRDQTGQGFRDAQHVLGADFSTRLKNQELSLGGSWSRAIRNLANETSEFRSVVARHHWTPMAALSVSTTANFTQTIDNALGGATDLTVLQANSVGLWHQDGSPYTLTGAARGMFLRDAIGHTDIATLGLMAGGTYELTKNVRLTGGANVNLNATGAARSQSVNATVGASWQGDTVKFADFNWDRFASATVGGGVGSGSNTPDQQQTSLAVTAGHTLSRSWPLASSSALALTASQSLGLSQARSSAGSESLSSASRALQHMLALTYNITRDNKSAFARASLSDSRELGGTGARFQLFNFQLSGTIDFSQHSALTGDLTFQRSQQYAGTAQPDALGLFLRTQTGLRGVSGEITYRHNRLFGVPRLRFSSRIKLAQDVLNQPGVLVSIPDHETRMWENRLDWGIGRLETGVLYRISRIDRSTRDFLMLRVQRNFGE